MQSGGLGPQPPKRVASQPSPRPVESMYVPVCACAILLVALPMAYCPSATRNVACAPTHECSVCMLQILIKIHSLFATIMNRMQQVWAHFECCDHAPLG